MSNTPSLMPCPFCGSPDVEIADDLVTFNVLCNACGASGGYSGYRNGAAWLWNRRIPPPTQAADSVKATHQEVQEPVAYAIFAENGNIRLWATEPQHVKHIAAEQGLSLVKLYTHHHPPEGMVMVPKEPTVAQRDAMRKGTGMSFSETKIAYTAMLEAAAPTTSAGSKGE